MTGPDRTPRPVRVLYVQYTNPAIYPPLLHSTALLAEAGCDVHVFGLDTMDADLAARYPPGVRVTLVPAQPPGWRQKTHFGRFAWRVQREAARLRPEWVYASDALSTPIARLVRARSSARLVYHEHDTPREVWRPDRASWFMRQVMRQRTRAVRQADICVVPSEARARALEAATGRRDITVVWNCPRRSEATVVHARSDQSPLRLLYQGSVVPARLPLAIVDALARLRGRVRLVVAGYETIGHRGYLQSLIDRAGAAGVGDAVTYAGVLNRVDLLELCASSDVGLAVFPTDTTDPNESSMIGASNKAFEYLAQGMPLVVADRPEWRETFVASGLARSCDPSSPASIAEALGWYIEHPTERQAMGERGRQRVLRDWNYETEFAPVVAKLTRRDATRQPTAIA